jgi:sterol desaturase/sphingolipid hydroxylase (fatty acid hydroxylase superfamily)
MRVLVAYWTEAVGFGLLSWLSLSTVQTVLFGFIMLDLSSYILHRVSHRWPLLWRLHLVHHSDTDVDVSTSYRHHPLESVFAALWYTATILILGVPLAALLIFEALHKFFDIFSHTNMRVPKRLDTLLRWVFITPDMHRIHHSAWQEETDSNYGGLLSIWDRLLGTYCKTLSTDRAGLNYFRSKQDQSLLGLILQPFRYVRSMAQSGLQASLSAEIKQNY